MSSAADRGSRAKRRNFEHRYFGTAAVAMAILIFLGFARSYYLKGFFKTPSISLPVHIHGVVMTGWIVILLIEVLLISAGRVNWHRRLGEVGAAWAVMVVMLGTMTTLRAAAREVAAHSESAAGQVVILGLELTQMGLFAAFAGVAIAWRRRTDIHKRLMLLATICLLPSAFARLPLLPFGLTTNQSILLLLNLFVVGSIATDTWRRRRLHPAFGWGGLALAGSLNLVFLAAYSQSWIRIGTWLVS